MKRGGTKPVAASDYAAVVTMVIWQRVGKQRRSEPWAFGIGRRGNEGRYERLARVGRREGARF
jgi:hypothetical protein